MFTAPLLPCQGEGLLQGEVTLTYHYAGPALAECAHVLKEAAEHFYEMRAAIDEWKCAMVRDSKPLPLPDLGMSGLKEEMNRVSVAGDSYTLSYGYWISGKIPSLIPGLCDAG